MFPKRTEKKRSVGAGGKKGTKEGFDPVHYRSSTGGAYSQQKKKNMNGAVAILAWGNPAVPVDFELLRKKSKPASGYVFVKRGIRKPLRQIRLEAQLTYQEKGRKEGASGFSAAPVGLCREQAWGLRKNSGSGRV